MERLRSAYRVAVIIGLAMMASLLVYLVVVALMEGGTISLREPAAIPAATLELLKFAFLGISVLVFALVRPLTRKILNAGGLHPRRTALRQQDRVAAPDTAGPLVNAAVIAFALCEMPAILGLVLYVLARNISDFYLFLLISLFAFSVHFPRYSQWEKWYRGKHQ